MSAGRTEIAKQKISLAIVPETNFRNILVTTTLLDENM